MIPGTHALRSERGSRRLPTRLHSSIGTRIATVSLLALLLLSLRAPAAQESQTWQPHSEHWYVLEINGAKVGHTRIIVQERDDQLRTTSETRMSISRGRAPIDVAVGTEFIESRDGEPISMTLRQELSDAPLETTWTFGKKDIKRVTAQGDRTDLTSLPALEGVWLTPRAVHRFITERLDAGASRMTYRTLDPQAGLQPIAVTSRRTGGAMYVFENREIPVTVWSTKSEFLPVVSVEWYSTDGHLVRHEITSGLGRLITRLATREEALEVGDGAAPELLLQTFVTPNRPIDQIMRAGRAVYRLSVRDSELPDLPSAGAQRVERIDAGAVRLTIDVTDPLPAGSEKDDPAYIESSSIIDSNDSVVHQLAKAVPGIAAADDTTPAARAAVLRRFVSRFVDDKSLDQAFASASETARSRAGDCSEHAVLLAAMLRAEGIPARVALGLVYVDQFAGEEAIFGWHMWTQALIDDRWIDLDATLPVDYHAGHILIATSALGDDAMGLDLASLLMLMGNVEIDVIEVSHEQADERPETSPAEPAMP